MPKLNIVKIGGTIIEDKNKLLPFLNNITGLKGPKILVHGGGKRATSWAKKLGIPFQIKDGRRVTNKKNLEIATMVYAGELNKKLLVRI